MGALWYKTDDGWKQGIPYGRLANGWAKSIAGYRKTAPTVWTSLYTTDLTPPAAATIPSITIGADLTLNQGRLTITVKAPSTSDTIACRVKVGKTVSANNTTDANYVATVDGTGKPWSEWDMTPNQTKSKVWPLAGNLTANATYYVTVWAMDRTRNYSAPVSKSIKYVVPAVLTAKELAATFVPTDSSSIRKSNNTWYTGDKFLRTGGPENWHGLWFYSTRISAALKGAKGIEKMTLQIQRYPSGYVGKTKFRLFAHKLQARPAGSIWSPNNVVYTDPTIYEIERSQTLNVPIPSSWFPAFLNGTIQGFGIFTGTSKANDVYQTVAYGFGTFSGRVITEYRK